MVVCVYLGAEVSSGGVCTWVQRLVVVVCVPGCRGEQWWSAEMAQKALPVSMQHETTMMCWSWSGGGVTERGTWSGGGVVERGRRMSSGSPVDSW